MVGKKEISNSPPILISPLSLPPVSNWGETLKTDRRPGNGDDQAEKRLTGRPVLL